MVQNATKIYLECWSCGVLLARLAFGVFPHVSWLCLLPSLPAVLALSLSLSLSLYVCVCMWVVFDVSLGVLMALLLECQVPSVGRLATSQPTT